jgi:hypothetical protein
MTSASCSGTRKQLHSVSIIAGGAIPRQMLMAEGQKISDVRCKSAGNSSAINYGVSCTKVASEFCKLAAVGSIPTDSTGQPLTFSGL